MTLQMRIATNCTSSEALRRRGPITAIVFGAMASPDQELLMSVVPPGDWYILVYSEATPEPGDYSLVVTTEDMFIKHVTPDRHGDSEDVVITVTGLGFSSNTTVELVAGDGTSYAGHPGRHHHFGATPPPPLPPAAFPPGVFTPSGPSHPEALPQSYAMPLR